MVFCFGPCNCPAQGHFGPDFFSQAQPSGSLFIGYLIIECLRHTAQDNNTVAAATQFPTTNPSFHFHSQIQNQKRQQRMKKLMNTTWTKFPESHHLKNETQQATTQSNLKRSQNNTYTQWTSHKPQERTQPAFTSHTQGRSRTGAKGGEEAKTDPKKKR